MAISTTPSKEEKEGGFTELVRKFLDEEKIQHKTILPAKDNIIIEKGRKLITIQEEDCEAKIGFQELESVEKSKEDTT